MNLPARRGGLRLSGALTDTHSGVVAGNRRQYPELTRSYRSPAASAAVCRLHPLRRIGRNQGAKIEEVAATETRRANDRAIQRAGGCCCANISRVGTGYSAGSMPRFQGFKKKYQSEAGEIVRFPHRAA